MLSPQGCVASDCVQFPLAVSLHSAR